MPAAGLRTDGTVGETALLPAISKSTSHPLATLCNSVRSLIASRVRVKCGWKIERKRPKAAHRLLQDLHRSVHSRLPCKSECESTRAHQENLCLLQCRQDLRITLKRRGTAPEHGQGAEERAGEIAIRPIATDEYVTENTIQVREVFAKDGLESSQKHGASLRDEKGAKYRQGNKETDAAIMQLSKLFRELTAYGRHKHWRLRVPGAICQRPDRVYEKARATSGEVIRAFN